MDTTVTTSAEREGLVAFLCDLFDWSAEVNGPDTDYYTMLRSNASTSVRLGNRSKHHPAA